MKWTLIVALIAAFATSCSDDQGGTHDEDAGLAADAAGDVDAGQDAPDVPQGEFCHEAGHCGTNEVCNRLNDKTHECLTECFTEDDCADNEMCLGTYRDGIDGCVPLE